MAFALTRFSAQSVGIESPGKQRAIQRVALDFTALATDLTWDLGTDGGTLWTSALAHATYGALATQALATLKTIVGISKALISSLGSIEESYNEQVGQKFDTLVFASAAGAGGAATEAMTVTGLAATDTILSVSQSVKGANSLPLLGFNTLAANALTGVWSADPGAGAIITVAVQRADVAYNATFTKAVANLRPNYVFPTASAPTTAKIVLEFELNDGVSAVVADLG